MQNDFAIQNIIKRSYATHKIKARHHRRLTRKPRRHWYDQGRTEDWWVRLLSGKLSDESWRKNFRMDKGNLMKLVGELESYIAPDPCSPNHRALSSQKKVALALYYLKDMGSLNQTSKFVWCKYSNRFKICY